MKLLAIGMRGSAVEFLQERLRSHGHHVALDGDFGEKTYAAVLQFQAANGLAQDGAVGDKTWAALRVVARVPIPAEHARDTVQWLKDIAKQSLKGQGWAALRYKAVLSALAYLGAEEDPPGANRGPEIDALVKGYPEHWQWIRPYKAPAWCAIAACVWVGEAVTGHGIGASMDWKKTPLRQWWGRVAYLEDWAKAQRCFVEASATAPAPTGAMYTMPRGNSSSDASTALTDGHAGIVIGDDPLDPGYMYCFDGNVGDEAGWKRRKKTDLRGYVLWYKLT